MKVKPRVLVMEDNAVNLALTVEMLSNLGLEALCVSDAESGIRLARETSPALILMDIQLPGMDGLDAARIIRADPAIRDTKIVAVTAFAMQGDREKILGSGCDGYISKPVRYREFFDTVRRVLGLDEDRAGRMQENGKDQD